MKSRTLLLLAVGVLFLTLLACSNVRAQTPTPVIEAEPDKIVIAITIGDTSGIPSATLYVTSSQAGIVSLNSTDFYEDQTRQLWIPSKGATLVPSHLNLSAGQTSSVEVAFNLHSNVRPGAYTGKIIIRGENGRVDIPVTIKIREPDSSSFLYIACGVFANLVISVVRWRFDSENSAKTAIELADTAIRNAEREGRMDYHYGTALNLQYQYRKDFEWGMFGAASEKASEAKNQAEGAGSKPKTAKPDDAVDLLSQIGKGKMYEQPALTWFGQDIVKRISPSDLLAKEGYLEHQKAKGFRFALWKFGLRNWTVGLKYVLTYASLVIIVGVVMLQAWQAFYPRIIDFGASTIDYVTAFLYGFSGQAFLNAFTDIGKRWLA